MCLLKVYCAERGLICLLNDITAVPITKLFYDCSVRTVVPITKRVVECSVVCLLLQVINCHAIIGNENTRFCRFQDLTKLAFASRAKKGLFGFF